MGTRGRRSPQNAIIFPHAAKLYLSCPHALNHSECVEVAKILFKSTLLSFYEAFLWQQTSDSKFITPLKVECLRIKSCGPQMCKPFCIHITHFSHSPPFVSFACFQINSPPRTPGSFPHGEQLEMRQRSWELPLPSQRRGQNLHPGDAQGVAHGGGRRSLKHISNPLGFSCLFQCSFIRKFADTQPSFDWLTNWSINYVFYCLAISH